MPLQQCPLLAPGTTFAEDNFSMKQDVGILSGSYKSLTFIMHFVSITITSAPPQIIGH